MVLCNQCKIDKDRDTEYYFTGKAKQYPMQPCKECRLANDKASYSYVKKPKKQDAPKAPKPDSKPTEPKIITRRPYRVVNQNNDLCANCPLLAKVKGLCKSCYTKDWLQKRSTRVPNQADIQCSNCTNIATTKGFCKSCYSKERHQRVSLEAAQSNPFKTVTTLPVNLPFIPAQSFTINHFKPYYYKLQQLYSTDPKTLSILPINQSNALIYILSLIQSTPFPMLIRFDNQVALEWQINSTCYTITVYEAGKVSSFISQPNSREPKETSPENVIAQVTQASRPQIT